jgi:hypothetical protein
MATKNYYHHTKSQKEVNPSYGSKHMFSVPFRMVICAGSGAGKTNTAINILENMPGTFTKVHLCIASPSEPLYDLLKEKLNDKLEIYTGDIPVGRGKQVQPNVPKLDTVAEEDDQGHRPQLLICDDLCLYEKQPRIEEYYIRGRKKGISMMYLTQSWFKCPPTVRRQCNYAILKRNVTESDLRRIKNASSLDIKFPDFCRLYRDCTQTMMDFMFLDLEKGKIYKNFEIVPLFENYKDTEEKDPVPWTYKNSNPGDIPQGAEKKFNWKDYHHKTTILMGIEAFIEAVRRAYPDRWIPYQDLLALYQQFCQDNNYKAGGDRYLSIQMSNVWPKDKPDGRTTLFYTQQV